MSAKPPPIPLHVLLPDTPPDWVLVGAERLMEGTWLNWACSCCLRRYGVPAGHKPVHDCPKRRAIRTRAATEPGKRGAL